jgi:hypothetical protein
MTSIGGSGLGPGVYYSREHSNLYRWRWNPSYARFYICSEADATKDVLPFATGLIGFLGGLVTAMYNRRDESSPPSGPTEPDTRI